MRKRLEIYTVHCFFLSHKRHGIMSQPTLTSHVSPVTSHMSHPQIPTSTSHLPPLMYGYHLSTPCLSTITSHVPLSPLTSHSPLSLLPLTLTVTLTLSTQVALSL